MRALSKLEVLHGGLTALALLVATIALGGAPALFEKAGIVPLCVVAFSVLSWFALGFLLPGARRSDSHWRAPLSNAAGNHHGPRLPGRRAICWRSRSSSW